MFWKEPRWMDIQTSEDLRPCNHAPKSMSKGHEWQVALHYRSLTELASSQFSERERSLQSSSVPWGPTSPLLNQKSLCVSSFVALADAPTFDRCFPQEKGLTKCGVLWLLRSQPAFEAPRQGPGPTEKAAAGQEVLTASVAYTDSNCRTRGICRLLGALMITKIQHF